MAAVESYFNKFDEERQALARQLRALVKAAAPELEESLKWGQPTYACNGNVCYISVKTSHINLGFYRGSELTGRGVTIEGTGKNLRHIKIRKTDSMNTGELVRLVQEAVQLEQM